jgi:hypothetical protein
MHQERGMNAPHTFTKARVVLSNLYAGKNKYYRFSKSSKVFNLQITVIHVVMHTQRRLNFKNEQMLPLKIKS